ncbi:MAG: hypothetical protein JNJ71_17870 [Rubrivivax sp.]|nr:hypothetical protein [Rubrivivax sp.]
MASPWGGLAEGRAEKLLARAVGEAASTLTTVLLEAAMVTGADGLRSAGVPVVAFWPVDVLAGKLADDADRDATAEPPAEPPD